MEMTNKILWCYGMEWHGNLFHIAGSLWAESTCWFPLERDIMRTFHELSLLDKQSRDRWFETPWRSWHWNICCITEIIIILGKYRRPNSVYFSLSWKSIAALLIMRVIEDNHVACSMKKKTRREDHVCVSILTCSSNNDKLTWRSYSPT